MRKTKPRKNLWNKVESILRLVNMKKPLNVTERPPNKVMPKAKMNLEECTCMVLVLKKTIQWLLNGLESLPHKVLQKDNAMLV